MISGSELHTGKKLSNSFGYYLLHNETPAHFAHFFPDKKAIIPVIQDILQRYDNALESLSLLEKRHFNETEFAENLQKEIKEGSYTPSPNIAFLIKKRNTTDRLVEQLNYKDLIVQQYIKKTIEDIFERTFEEESIGFRKGVSREKAIEMVQAGIAEGYRYVIESDIEDFFPSVDLNRLAGLLDHYLPQKDTCFKGLLLKSIRNGYILNGIYHERTKGLAQGSPLSPLLANLYLDSFDEEIKKMDVGMIRYADDFIILARSKEAAEEILSKSETFLFGLGIRIKKEKTSIKHIKEGFQFLGIRFERSEVRIEPEDEFKRLKKPLYITEPYLFLSLNGEAIDIKKNGAVIETIPIRRLSEIMVMDKAVFSTALIAKCTNSNIPISVTLNSGYYINTIKPDSKSYYDIAFQHGTRYYSLSETEVLCIAKEFAAGKINNYISLFRQRYEKEQNLFIKELEEAIMQIQEAGDINYIRGIEGSVAKKIYRELNTIIDDESFHIKKRERKNPDSINSLLNYGYYLLFSRINATVRAVGLNPYLGFLHSPLDNYESFVSDIVELFRARMDRFIIRLLNLKSITKDDFIETEKGMFLKKDAVKGFLNHFEAEMERKKGDASLSLKEEVYLQVYIFKKWVLENGFLSFYKWQV
ncbi:MAG: CRISPR-associated endonuclease Cas1 [Nitrospirota bacterium]